MCAAPEKWQFSWLNMVKNGENLSSVIIFDEGLSDPFFDGVNGHRSTAMIGYRILKYGASEKVIGARSERRPAVGRVGQARPDGSVAQGWTEGTAPARLMGRMNSSRLFG